MRWIASIVVGLVLAWVAYVLVGNWYIRERLPGRLNEKPDSFTATWDDARTWWPGAIRATNVRLVKQSDAVQWEMRLDRGRARFGLIPLLFEHLSVGSLDGDGLTVRVRFVPGKTPGAETGSPHAPPIEGLPDPPLQAVPPRPDDGKEGKWTYHFDDVAIDGVREAWIGPFRLAGVAAVRTGMDFSPGRMIDVAGFRFVVERGDVFVGPDTLAQGLTAKVDLELDRFDMETRKALEVFDEMSVDLEAKAALRDVQLPRASFPKVPWLGFGGGTGDAELDIRIDDGSFAPGSTMSLTADAFSLSYPGYEVTGAADIQGRVERDVLTPKGHARATFREFTIRKEGAPSAHVRGAGFTAELRTEDLTIHEPLETYEVVMTLPDSEIVDFNAYSSTIPEPLRVRIEQGHGTIGGSLTVSEKGGSGTLSLDGKEIFLTAGQDRMRMDMALKARIPELDFQAGRFAFDGTELAIRNALVVGEDLPEDGAWWGDFRIDRMLLQRGGDPLAMIEASGTFQDTRPMVAIVAREKPLLKLVRPVLLAPNVTMTTKLSAGPQLLHVDDLTMKGDKLDVRACVDARGESARGVFWVDGGALSAGFKFQDGRRNIKPLAGKAWYPEHAPLCENPAHLPPD